MAICCGAASSYPRAPVRQGLNEAAMRMDGVFAQMLRRLPDIEAKDFQSLSDNPFNGGKWTVRAVHGRTLRRTCRIVPTIEERSD
jgi:hypothetical protein